jgi:hypothetical protein
MYAAYLCFGIPCDIKEEQSEGTMNINHVRSMMIHRMDLRGQLPDGGQSDKVQVASDLIMRQAEDGHISVDPSRENSAVSEAAGAPEDGAGDPPTPDLTEQLKKARDQVAFVDTVLAVYQPAYTSAKTEHDQAQTVVNEIAEMYVQAEQVLADTQKAIDDAKQERDKTTNLIDSTSAAVTSANTLQAGVDAAIAKTEELSIEDQKLDWALDGSNEAKQTFDFTRSNIEDLQNTAQIAYITANKAVENEAEVCTTAQKALDDIMLSKAKAEAEVARRTLTQNLCSTQLQLLTKYKQDADALVTTVNNTLELNDSLATKSNQAQALQQHPPKAEADTAKEALNSQMRISTAALAAANTAARLAKESSKNIMEQLLTQQAAHDVALVFLHAGEAYAACTSVSNNEIADVARNAETSASDEQKNKLEEKLADVIKQAELFELVTDVQTAVTNAQTAVREALDNMDLVMKQDHALQANTHAQDITTVFLQTQKQALQEQVTTESREANTKYEESKASCTNALAEVEQIKIHNLTVSSSKTSVKDACAAVTAACAAAAAAVEAAAVVEETADAEGAAVADDSAGVASGSAESGTPAAEPGEPAATESTAPGTPTVVVESFQDFCTNKNTKNLAEKDTLMKVSHDIRPKFAMAQNMFLKFKILHNKNEEITRDI